MEPNLESSEEWNSALEARDPPPRIQRKIPTAIWQGVPRKHTTLQDLAEEEWRAGRRGQARSVEPPRQEQKRKPGGVGLLD